MASAQEQGQDPVPPCWIRHPFGGSQAPESFVIYIVAEIAGRHRPLAVEAFVQEEIDTCQPSEVVACCRDIARLLSDPANKLAIAAETSLAAEFYHDDAQNPSVPLQELPILNFWGLPKGWGSSSTDSGRPLEFPFISTVVRLAAGAKLTGHTPMPLGTVFRADNPHFGMAVFDITSLDDLKYGIVAFNIELMVFLETLDQWQEWSLWGRGPGGRTELRVESERPRRAILAKTFLTKFDKAAADSFGELERLSLVESAAFRSIWPSGRNLPSGDAAPLTRVHQTRARTARSLIDMAATSLVESTGETEFFDPSLFDEPRRLPAFKMVLRRSLQERSGSLGHSRSVAQLIALAFEEETHLDLVRYRGISAKSISDALEMDELGQIATLSVCVDALSSTPVEIALMLSSHLSLSNIYLLQSPTREDDEISIQTVLELFKLVEKAPRLPQIFASGVYSAALRHQTWLPMGYNPPACIAPVQCVFEREWKTDRRGPKYSWRWGKYHMGDALVSAHEFAARFLRCLRTGDFYLSRWDAGPPTLTGDDTSRMAMTANPARNIVDIPAREHLVPGSSHVLVSVEKHFDRGTPKRDKRTGMVAPDEFRYIRFAFVQMSSKFTLPQDATTDDDPLPRLTREDFTVRGLKGFLDAAAGAAGEGPVDPGMIDRRLADLGACIERAHNQAKRPADIEAIGVMGEDEVCEALNDMLGVLKGKGHLNYYVGI
ncbi:hypothetical protein F4802DRAFT_584000 [Xylaria palmicola]|nr:hypothetical protein F4802DRAFT_584000 [Xylaria palmicola]